MKEGTKIELLRAISQNGLQVVYCRFSAGVLQVVYRVFAVRKSYHYMSFPFNFRGSIKNALPTD